MSADQLLERAEQWLQHDPDANTRAELRALIERASTPDPAGDGQVSARADLADRFSGPLEFGTAGLRGVIGAGETRMNRAVVLRTTAGLARYLERTLDDEAKSRGVAVGYDGRRMSREFAEDTVSVLAAAGIPSHLSVKPCPTPLLAFAVSHLGAAAGVMITASHNPPEYNGYKAYWSNAAQIIPPHDKGIAAAIDEVPPADSVTRVPIDEARAAGLVRDLGDAVDDAYLARITALGVKPGGDRSLRIVYTPLHGVGEYLMRRAFEAIGFANVMSVPEQAQPDGRFPTVVFPNPEEKGALDLALALATKHDAALIVANDPDVDRLAVAVRTAPGKYTQLTGNQVGVLLGHYLLTEGKAEGKRVVLASIVSSPMLGGIAKALGVAYEETLTGFKWIANRALELEASQGARFVFGYEEALGYTVGDVVRDKDGISAALLLGELAAHLKADGKTLLDELERIARRFGFYASGQRSLTLPGANGLAQIGAMMRTLRATALADVGGARVLATSDYEARTRTPTGGAAEALALPKSNVLAYELEGGGRIIARPSGTEPKIKFYFDVREEVAAGEPLADAEARALAKIEALSEALLAIAKPS